MKHLCLFIIIIVSVSAQVSVTDTSFAKNRIGIDSSEISYFYENNEITLQPEKLDSISLMEKPDVFRRQFNYPVIITLGAVTATSLYFINDYYQNTWWRDKAEFKFMNDWKYALWIDKLGHFYGTYLQSFAFSSGFEASGFHTEESAWYGASCALALQLYIEVQDGYGPQWGFSPGDAVSDLLGSSYFVLKYYYPYLNNFQPRVSYYPSKEYLNRTNNDHNIMDDYEGQKLWLSIRIKNLLPESVAEYWPSFLMLSIGYAVKNHQPDGYKENEFYIAFDIDAEEIPLFGKGWQFVKNTLNYLHFPLPGLRISPGLKFVPISY
ncbi:MAG: DUF2279 domain-containing protein [Ignavibacteria bacterium]|nr:DUF2279 domain-containing protein [Ignavibacteria bacterium]